MIDSPAEIVRSYRMAADPKKQIKVLAELNACSVKEIRRVLVGEGVLPRETTVTVEELRALLEDACRDGLGECAVLVEGTAFADLWLDVHSTLRIYESGERTVELKGTAKSA